MIGGAKRRQSSLEFYVLSKPYEDERSLKANYLRLGRRADRLIGGSSS
ncbi:hypothetical protein Pse7429DRAFT_3006 [Pseudanabaena biceps PCC 7429]|uniref:Uncharacterized protein n=1 Tax=Pseudanabaena biceps PCC 7429 TaxID=927668 RepID=L8N030_9CYAN|nr:hypothetical protein Pse7429DRAFT_3006 [Pseudanabaena biceps PCC 7429]